MKCDRAYSSEHIQKKLQKMKPAPPRIYWSHESLNCREAAYLNQVMAPSPHSRVT